MALVDRLAPLLSRHRTRIIGPGWDRLRRKDLLGPFIRSRSGKTTIAEWIEKRLLERNLRVERLDGDSVRTSLTKDLGFSKEDRLAHIERVAFVARLLTKHDVIVLASFISPYREMRERCRRLISPFAEVYVKCPLEECIRRDVKGLYARALKGEIRDFTGISAPFEEPRHPDLILNTDVEEPEESASKVIAYLERNGYIPAAGGGESL